MVLPRRLDMHRPSTNASTTADSVFISAGISSLKLLAEVGRLLAEKGFAVVNIDATLLAQAPKVGPYRARMAENIAGALKIEPEQVNIKATTEEKLGFTGDGSGMAAHAVVLVEKVN